MKASRLAVLALAGAFALPTLAHAQPASSPTTVYSFHFDSTSTPTTVTGSSVIVGPYWAHEATTPPGNPFDMFCIDYDNHAQTTWNARVVRFADILANTNGAGTAAANALGVSAITSNQLNLSGYLADQMQLGQSHWLDNHTELWRIFSSNSQLSTYTDPTADLATSGKGVQATLENYDMLIDERAFLHGNETRGACSNPDGVSTGACSQTFIIPGTVNDRIITPEPGTYALMGAGLLALGIAGRRRRRVA